MKTPPKLRGQKWTLVFFSFFALFIIVFLNQQPIFRVVFSLITTGQYKYKLIYSCHNTVFSKYVASREDFTLFYSKPINNTYYKE